MTPDADRALRVRELFAQLVDTPREERELLLGQASRDPAVLEEVRELLSFEGTGGAAVDRLAPGLIPRPAALPRVAGYEVIAEIGDGSSGRVFHAVRRSDGQAVAIKVLRHVGDEMKDAGRFRREVAILERLDHPGVASFYESTVAQTSLGSAPCLVMQLIQGQPITAHCDSLDLDDTRRIELLSLVCDAVQHAHEQGVVHRDLKPANVLVDELGQPFVVDFGIAQAHAAPGFETFTRTREGDLLGTLAYMSPEQARGKDGQVDARSDVYSLGVLLFQLLTGQLPIRIAGSTLTDALRSIAHDEPISLVENRPDHEGDLATIVGRALEKEREARYATAAALAADLRRYLAHEAILARPPGTVEQLRRFARRNRAFVIASAAVLVALVTGIAGLGIGVVEARASEERAREAAVESDEMLESLLGFVEAPALEGAGYDVQVADLLADFAERIRNTTTLRAGTAARLHRQIGETFSALGLSQEAVKHLEQSLALDPKPKTRADRAETHFLLADELLRLMDVDDAMDHLGESREIRSTLFGEESAEVGMTEARIAFALRVMGDFEGAARRAEAAYELLIRELGDHAEEVYRAADIWAGVLIEQGKYEQAEVLHRAALAGIEQIPDASARSLEIIRGNYAVTLRQLRRPNEARALYDQALARALELHGPDHVHTYFIRLGLGTTLKHQQDFRGAIEQLELAASGIAELYGPMHRETLVVHDSLAQALFVGGRQEEAVALQQTVVDRWLQLDARRDNAAMHAFNSFAQFFHYQRRFEEALPWIERAAAVARTLHRPSDLQCIVVDGNVAQAMISLGRGDEGEPLLRDVVQRLEALGDAYADRLCSMQANLGWHLTQTQRLEEGEALLRQAVTAVEAEFPAGSIQRVRFQGHLADTLRMRGDAVAARAVLDRMEANLKAAPVPFEKDAERHGAILRALSVGHQGPLDDLPDVP